MKYLYWLVAIAAVIYVLPVIDKYNTSSAVSGGSIKSADKSAKKMTKYLTSDERVVFNTAYGLLKELKTADSGETAFLDSVKGLDPQGVISLARSEVNSRIARGDSRFQGARDWDEWIKKVTYLKEPPPKKGGK